MPPGDRALCKWAAKLTARASDTSPGDLDRLREAGFDDRAIHDAAQVVGFFNYITRIADGLGVEPEDFIREWGSADRESRAKRREAREVTRK